MGEIRAEPMPAPMLFPHRRKLRERVPTFMVWTRDPLHPVLTGLRRD